MLVAAYLRYISIKLALFLPTFYCFFAAVSLKTVTTFVTLLLGMSEEDECEYLSPISLGSASSSEDAALPWASFYYFLFGAEEPFSVGIWRGACRGGFGALFSKGGGFGAPDAPCFSDRHSTSSSASQSDFSVKVWLFEHCCICYCCEALFSSWTIFWSVFALFCVNRPPGPAELFGRCSLSLAVSQMAVLACLSDDFIWVSKFSASFSSVATTWFLDRFVALYFG